MSKHQAGIRLYLDSADTNEWQRFFDYGLLYGITTNPKILSKAQLPCTIDTMNHLIHHAFQHPLEEFHAQVWGDDVEQMTTRGMQLAELHPKVYVKVPATLHGFQCAANLREYGVKLTLTAVYAAQQAVIAAAIGAAYAAPYLGRMMDNGIDGTAEIMTMQKIVQPYPTRLLIASIRRMEDVVLLASMGVQHFTIAPEFADQFIVNDLSNQAAVEFDRYSKGDSL